MASPPRVQAPDPRGAHALERLLQDLGPQIQRGGSAAQTLPAPCPTGLDPVDQLLGGGFPRGRLSEIAGPPGCGRTSLALALLSRSTAAGHIAAVVDGADAFDPVSAAAAGVDLRRVLWIRPAGLPQALRSLEHVLAAGGFDVALLDLAAGVEPRTPCRVPDAAWTRLRQRTAATQAALVVLGNRRLAGTFADLALELDAARPRFQGAPAWLAALDGQVRLVRNRTGPQPCTSVRWQTAA